MAANKHVIKLLRKQQATLERMIARAGESISGWKEELGSLLGAISALSGSGKKAGRPRMTKSRKRGTWKPGRPGRPPKWYLDQQKVKGKQSGMSTAKVKGKRKKKVSPRVLAALAKAREARAAKRAAAG